MTTDKGLTGSEKVRKLQTVLHEKAKEEPELRFHALSDKLWREDFLQEAWAQVRRNGGSAGVAGPVTIGPGRVRACRKLGRKSAGTAGAPGWRTSRSLEWESGSGNWQGS